METIFLILAVAAIFVIRRRPRRPKFTPSIARIDEEPFRSPRRSEVRQPQSFDSAASQPPLTPRVINGKAYVIDGDTIRIDKTQIRLYGIDAPEMNHPYGKAAKWAMIHLCKGLLVRAEVTDTDDHGRTVAKCTLPDGRDLSAELVKQGLAIDWPKFSGGIYKSLEPDGVRKKLWLADARQKGRMHVWEKYDAQQAAKSKPQ